MALTKTYFEHAKQIYLIVGLLAWATRFLGSLAVDLVGRHGHLQSTMIEYNRQIRQLRRRQFRAILRPQIRAEIAMPLSGHVILIVEPYLLPFVTHLQDAIEAEQGDSVVARDPSTALARCRQFQFTAALVNIRHRDMVGKLTMPVMLYSPQDGLAIVLIRLKQLLSLRRLKLIGIGAIMCLTNLPGETAARCR